MGKSCSLKYRSVNYLVILLLPCKFNARWWGKIKQSQTSPTGKSNSECIAGPDVLKLLGHLRWGSVQLFGDILLFVGLHGVELLTEVSVNHILNREIIGTKAEVVSPTERGMLRPQVHLHVLEEVMVLMRCEGDKDANSS